MARSSRRHPDGSAHPFDRAVAERVPESSPLRYAEPRGIFCPPAELAPDRAAAVARLYRALSSSHRALFLPAEESSLVAGAIPGPSTLLTPRFPELAATALLSASRVVSFRPLPAAIALVSGVPAVCVGFDGSGCAEAEELGVPHASLSIADSDEANVGRIERALRELDVRERSATVGKRAKALGLDLSPRREPAPASSKVSVASISDSRYLPFLAGFIERVLFWEGRRGVRFFVLGLDENVRPELERRYPDVDIEVHGLGDLWTARELPTILERSIGTRAFSTKPRLVERALARARGPVVYADSDVDFFAPPRVLVDALGDSRFLVFPHWNDVASRARADGLFNAGMVVAGSGAEDLLRWWGDQCLNRCSVDASSGTVGDQGYLDFLSLLFDGVAIYKGCDHNVARWNLGSLGVHFDERSARPVVADGSPVLSFHAAFVDGLGLFERKFAWDQLVHFFAGEPGPAAQQEFLFRQWAVQQARHWLDLGRLVALSARAGLPALLTPRSSRWFTRGVGRGVMAGLAAVHRARAGGDAAPADDPWISRQRAILFAEPAVSGPRRRRAR